MGLGGVMIWEVGQDCQVDTVTHGENTHIATCPHGEESALLTAICKGAPAQESPIVLLNVPEKEEL